MSFTHPVGVGVGVSVGGFFFAHADAAYREGTRCLPSETCRTSPCPGYTRPVPSRLHGLLILVLLCSGCPGPGGGEVAPLTRRPKPLAPDLRQRADQGIEAVRRGELDAGRRTLLSVLGSAEGEERIALLAALAHAEERLGDTAAARRHAAELYRLSDRPAERAFARQLLGSDLPADDAGNKESTQAPPTIGVLVPASGPYRLAGRELLTGALAGAGIPGGARLRIIVEDDSGDAARAARALLERGALALLAGPGRAASSRAVAQVAQRSSAALLSAACGEPLGEGALCLFPSGQARARALATHALRSGLRRFAVLAPRSAYGRAMSTHFGGELSRGGGALIVELNYPEGTRSFGAELKRLSGQTFDALFIPDSAQQLALVAPALASEGILPAARQAKRRVIVLATADGLAPGRLGGVSRHLEGAVLAPGFASEAVPAARGTLLRAVQQELGQPPSLLQAYAADAAAALRAGIQAGHHERAALLNTLRRGGYQGLTGPLSFAADGSRSSPVLLYRIEGEKLQPLN